MFRCSSLTIVSLCWVLCSANWVYANDRGLDKSKIAIGGYSLVRNATTLSLTEPNIGAGVSINPEDTLGLQTKQTVFKLDGYYRFTKQHGLTYSWYRISSDGNKSIEEQFEWVDKDGKTIIIPVGAQVKTNLDYDIYKLGYLWSFYNTDKVELAAGVGLHLTRFELGLQADTTSSGIEARDVSLTVPLPVLSFRLSYSVTPKFFWYLRSEVFTLAYKDWEGTYTDSTLGVEFRAFNHVGFGIGLGNNNLNATEETNDYKFNYQNKITGLSLYVAAYF